MKAAVLGCGPAGLLAAEALNEHGVKADIYSVKVKSPHGGAQYLHTAIPGVTALEPDGEIRYLKVGTREGYAEKVYGDPNVKVSWDYFDEGMVLAWSMRKVYDLLWSRWEHRINNESINWASVERFQQSHDIVISSIGLPSICRKPVTHEFNSQGVILVPDAVVPVHNTILYNGQPTENWYRSSYLFGVGWTEYAEHADGPPIMGDRNMGFKPVSNSCDCHPDVIRVGRFGRWERDVLIHHVWDQVLRCV